MSKQPTKKEYSIIELKFKMKDKQHNTVERQIGQKMLEAIQIASMEHGGNFWKLLIEQSEPVSKIKLLNES